jgi:hypothetical protein
VISLQGVGGCYQHHVIHQLLLLREALIHAENDAANPPDDHHHADDYEEGGEDEDKQPVVILPEIAIRLTLKYFQLTKYFLNLQEVILLFCFSLEAEFKSSKKVSETFLKTDISI